MAEQQREDRVRKLDALRALGADPFGDRFDGHRPAAEIVAGYVEGQAAVAAGRVRAIRGHGKTAFIDLRDASGKIQLFVKRDVLGEAGGKLLDLLDLGDLVGVRGVLLKTKTGEVSIQPTELRLLAKALRPLPEKWHGLKDPELRYRRRYLDLISNPDVTKVFLDRSKIISRIRRLLDDRGYVEVETPMMHAIPGGATARPFKTHHNALDADLFLRIALEIPLKKVMIGGVEKVYEIGRVFRNEGVDTHHNPEFTLLELYHAYGNLETMMELVETLFADLARTVAGTTILPFGDGTVDVTPPWPREDYAELLRRHAGVGIDSPDEELVAKLRAKGAETKGLDRMGLIDKVFSEYAEPHLRRATFVCNQPLAMTPLCRERRDRPGAAERFEAFLAGMELANAYTELNDPLEQRKRLEDQAKASGASDAGAGKVDEDFVRAMEHGMPPAGGLGIGIDRLVMLLTNRTSIREVILFPLMKEQAPGAEADETAEETTKDK